MTNFLKNRIFFNLFIFLRCKKNYYITIYRKFESTSPEFANAFYVSQNTVKFHLHEFHLYDRNFSDV